MRKICYKDPTTLEEVKVYDKRQVEEYCYFETYEVKRFLRKPILYKNIYVFAYSGYSYLSYLSDSVPGFYTEDEILSNKSLQIEDNMVYDKPRVTLFFKDSSITRKFDTFELASKWAQDFLDSNLIDRKFLKFEIDEK